MQLFQHALLVALTLLLSPSLFAQSTERPTTKTANTEKATVTASAKETATEPDTDKKLPRLEETKASSGGSSTSLGNKIGIGVELGGAPTFLFSDGNVQAFGLGLGNQIGIYGTYWNDRPIALKARIEHVYLREEALNRADMSYYISDSYLKSMTQEYLLFGAGAEFRTPGLGNMFFYEAMFGYAIGVSGSVEVTPGTGSTHVEGRKVPLRSNFYLGGGMGMRRKFSNKLLGVATGRSFLTLGAPYEGGLKNKLYIPFPVMLSVGLEYLF